MKCSFIFEYVSAKGHGILTEERSSDSSAQLTIADDGRRRTVKLFAKEDIEVRGYRESSHDFFEKVEKEKKDKKGDLWFMNGYQSWTDTKEFYISEREKNVSRLPKFLINSFAFDRYGDALFYSYSKKYLHGYDLFYVKGSINGFAASLNSDNAFLIFTLDRESGEVAISSDLSGLTLQAGEEYTVCDYIYAGSFDEGQLLFDLCFPKKQPEKIFGYTSWYNYYQDISEQVILRDLSALDSRFNLFQIDDGYETFVGDWLDVDPAKFPSGLSPIVDKIHEKGLMAGLWLAPLVAEEKSRLFKEKPDFFKKDENGQPVKCGANWSGFYALDLEKHEVRDYIAGCLRQYSAMGFDFFKLDFLYAASLPSYKGKTRARAAAEAYAFLRECLPGKLILGCGATLSSAVGKFDYMRIGPDVSLKFDDVWYMRFMHRERVSTKVTLQNTVYRSILNCRYFGNDPDVFLLRDNNLSLSPEQKRALITINALFGSVMMTSDNIAEYDDGKKALLADSLGLFKNAEAVGYGRDKNIISITCRCGDDAKILKYDTKKGVLL